MGGRASAARPGASPPPSAPAPPTVPATPVTVRARTAGGGLHVATVRLCDTVRCLKEELARSCGIPACRQKLLLGGAILQDSQVLGLVAGVADDAELSLVIGPPVPEWAEALGFSGEHPVLLRDYFDRHGLEAPEWLASDDQVWERLAEERQGRERRRKSLEGWGHLLNVERGGEPAGILRAAPGETLQVKFSGFIHNNKGDSCIHQLILAVDASIAAELSDGVPGRGREISKKVGIKAPKEVGTYMLWRYGDLQYSMRDARRNFERGQSKISGERYPKAFVGWLVVEDC